MNLLFLTQQGGILGPFAWALGKILNAIYDFLSLFGIENIAICIVLFTFVTKMLMLPLTIKQQKGAKLSAKMNPEISKIQAKYKGKKDSDSMRRQQAEMQEVYAKYGSSPMSGCLPLLISLPIMFALYRVIYMIPAYVTDVRGMYEGIANAIVGIENYPELIKNFIEANGVKQISLDKFAEFNDGSITISHLVDIFTNFSFVQWTSFKEAFSSVADAIGPNIDQITHINKFIGNMNILDAPGYQFPGIIIPILAAASQWMVGKLSTVSNPSQNVDNPAAQSMKTMNTIMPLMSGVFCAFLPIGVGIYWVCSSLFQIIQQFFINRYMDNADIDAMIEKNVAKSDKKKEKMGIVKGTNKMDEFARKSTKSIEVRSNSDIDSSNSNSLQSSNYNKGNTAYTPGSISAIANILKNKNIDKGDK